MADRETMERVNPVFNTAKGTLLMLSQAGVPEAENFCRQLGFQLTQFGGAQSPAAMMSAMMCMQEMRYRCINSLVMRAGNQNVLDIACGFSPRGLLLSGMNMNYIGCDLPAAIEELQNVLKKNAGDGSFHYYGMDVTNDESVRQVSGSFSGPVTIITEGLLSYFIESELRTVYRNLHRVLSQHGGCWITCDFDRSYLKAAIGVIFGEEQAGKILGGIIKQRDAVADSVPQDDAAVRIGREMLHEYGMTAAAVPFYQDDFALTAGLKISKEHQEALLNAFRRLKLYVITLDGSNPWQDQQTEGKASAFTAEKTAEGETIRITGRLDTLSAPALLEYCEQLPESTVLTLDLVDMAFISSAGMRTLAMIGRRFPNLSLTQIGEELRPVLEKEIPQMLACEKA